MHFSLPSLLLDFPYIHTHPTLCFQTKQNEQKASNKNQETPAPPETPKQWKPKQWPVGQKQNAQIKQNEIKRSQKCSWVCFVLANYSWA